MRSKIFPLFLISTLLCFAGLADSANEYRAWVKPAYITCAVSGSVWFVILALLTWIYREKTCRIYSKVSEFLKMHNLLGVIATGVLIAIPLTILYDVGWHVYRFAVFPLLIPTIILMPLLLSYGRFRNKILLNQRVLKWMSILAVSAILASVVFVLLVKIKVVPFWDSILFEKGSEDNYPFYTHPWDSLVNIWGGITINLLEVLGAMILVGCGNVIRYLWQKYKSLATGLNW